MRRAPVGLALRDVERIFEGSSLAGFSEGQLLDHFARTRDDAAFEAIVRLHGRMVLAACRRLLGDRDAAEDAFQATFLVLARRAGSIGDGRPLAPWLLGVAQRVAAKARVAEARRRRRETVAARRRAEADDPSEGPPTFDLAPIIWEELHRLPSKYRDPLVLCCIEGRTHIEAAELLHWPVGTVKGRLHRGRDTLRDRLARRGVAAPAAGLGTWLAAESALAIVPPALIATTVRAAITFAARSTFYAAVAPASSALLAQGVLRTMTATKLTAALGTLALFGGGLATGLNAYAFQSDGDTTPASIGPEQQQTNPRTLGASAPTADGGESDVPTSTPTAFAGVENNQPSETTQQVEQSTLPDPEPLDEELSSPTYDRSDVAGLEQLWLKRARRSFEVSRNAFEAGGIDIDRYLESAERLLQARLAAEPNQDQKLYYEYLKSLQSIADRESEKRQAGIGSDVDLAAARLALARAEALFAEKTASDVEAIDRAVGESTEERDNDPQSGPEPGAGPSDQGSAPAETGNEGTGGPGTDPASKAILAILERPISMPFEYETPLGDMLEYVKQATADQNLIDGIPIYVDPIGLKEAEETLQSPITMNLSGVPLKTTLWLALRQLGLAYTVRDGLLIISARDGSLLDLLTESPIFDEAALERDRIEEERALERYRVEQDAERKAQGNFGGVGGGGGSQ